MYRAYLLATSLVFALFAAAQPVETDPISWSLNLKKNNQPVVFKNVPVAQLLAEDAENDEDISKPWRFGYEFTTDLDPGETGDYYDLDNGDRVWVINIKSPGAYSVNVLFDWYRLAPGALARIYSNDRQDISQVFSYKQNNEAGVLGTWPIQGDNIWVELYEPKDVIGLSSFEIGTVVHGYRSIVESTFAKALNDSGACNHDVDCDITPRGADPFQIDDVKELVKKSVGMVVINGSGICSGALVNNTAQDASPYFLTANHCLAGTDDRVFAGSPGTWAFRFNWRSPTARCATTRPSSNGNFVQTASGASLLMRNDRSDTALVGISDEAFFQNNPDVYFAGWNRSTGATPVLNFGIHHPSGDIQKVCRDDDGAERRSIGFNSDPNTQVWQVFDWDLGVTERGSSGSPLFNEQGSIIGVLSGGSAACNGTSDNGGFDVYGRFDNAWNFGNMRSTRLSTWLDPAATNAITLEGASYQTLSITNPSQPTQEQIKIFPNPSNGLYTIETTQDATYQVFNLNGQLILQGSTSLSNNEVDITTAADGLYFVKINAGAQSTTAKIVKQ
jgi:hypothetical protein